MSPKRIWMPIFVAMLLSCSACNAGLLSLLCGRTQNRDSCCQSEESCETANVMGGLFCTSCDSDECDCDRQCCENCGKKKPKNKKKCCLLAGLDCAEPPRGEMGVVVPGRLQRTSFNESARDRKKSDDDSESGADGDDQDRIDQLEEDLTRLTQVVESVAASQVQQQEDLTRATQVLEEMARRFESRN